MAGGFFRCSLNRDFLCHQGFWLRREEYQTQPTEIEIADGVRNRRHQPQPLVRR